MFLELKKGKSEVEICINKQTFPFKPVMQSSVVYTDVYAVFYKNNWFNLRKPVGKNDSLLIFFNVTIIFFLFTEITLLYQCHLIFLLKFRMFIQIPNHH